MKKVFALILALCLLCGAALADITSDGGTSTSTLTYTIQPCESFIVTIPSSVTLKNTGDKLSGTVSISLNTDQFNVAGKMIEVRLSATANDFNLVSGEKKIPYNIKAAGVEYKVGDTVLSWTYGSANMPQALVVQSTQGLSSLPAGDYSDTLTFSVAVADAPNTDSNSTN